MSCSTILVVSREPARCEPLLTLLRRRQSWPVLTSDVGQATVTAADVSVALIVLNGSQEFCQPFFQSFSELRLKQAAPPLLVLATDSSEAFAISSLRAGAAEYLTEPLDLVTLAQSISRWVPECAAPPLETDLTGGEVLVG